MPSCNYEHNLWVTLWWNKPYWWISFIQQPYLHIDQEIHDLLDPLPGFCYILYMKYGYVEVEGWGRYKHKLKGERSALRLLSYLAARPASLYKKGIGNLSILKLRGYKKQPFILSSVRHSRKGTCKMLCRVYIKKKLCRKDSYYTVFVHIAEVYCNIMYLQLYQFLAELYIRTHNLRLSSSIPKKRQQQAIAVFHKRSCIHQFLAVKDFYTFCFF